MSIILDDTITKTIVIECADKNTLIAVRDGVIYELSNDQPVTINYSVLADIQVNMPANILVVYKTIFFF